MQHFDSDYMEGAHEKIIERLVQTNREQTPGYGSDMYCESAKEKIKTACKNPDAKVYFLVGGTQTNVTVIDTLLKSYEGVVAAKSGHVATHEAGAIEFGGHKVLELEAQQGKLSAETVKSYIAGYYKDENYEHMVAPGMVYISHPTEYGTLYTKRELEELANVCREYEIPLYLDGARLGYGLAASDTDVDLETLSECCDVYYIGGTKVGALFGEAVVVNHYQECFHRFLSIMKQHGALMAKGRMLGLQFDTLFTDNLYLDIARHAIKMAEKLRNGLEKAGCQVFIDSPTNQQFVVLENKKMKELSEHVSFGFWENYDENHTVVRFATSWATKEEDIDKLLELLA
ncbi:MAG: aminotransferase class I/II-fold pyridoxal phosphate-dependent enzyme [Lachnospiraceae bacterium]|jgi:threonine aldolase|nr:aminotransferase class I/II-fold pyridoxal phosphate-dependent enzyme [Lachnospiraceae bacterium]MDD3615408.1 aminotransferase class I/II-fold pyridoxal phosphate-dependent enzyme [Lachnospiraceae bacterium]